LKPLHHILLKYLYDDIDCNIESVNGNAGIFTPQFLVHVDRLLCYDQVPKSYSWQHAGTSYVLRVLCLLLYLPKVKGYSKFDQVIRNANDSRLLKIFEEEATRLDGHSSDDSESIVSTDHGDTASRKVQEIIVDIESVDVNDGEKMRRLLPRALKVVVYKFWAESCLAVGYDHDVLMGKLPEAVSYYNSVCGGWDKCSKVATNQMEAVKFTAKNN